MGNTYSSYQPPIRKDHLLLPRRTTSPSRVRRYIETSFDTVDLESLVRTFSKKDAEDLKHLIDTKAFRDPIDAVNSRSKVSRVVLPEGREFFIPSNEVDAFVRKIEGGRRSRSPVRRRGTDQEHEQDEQKEKMMIKAFEERQRLFEEEQKRSTGLEKSPPIKQSSFKGECFDFLVEFDEVPIKEFLTRDRENIVVVTVTPGKEEASATCASKEYLRTYKRRYGSSNYVKIPAIVAGGGDVFVSAQNLDDVIRYGVRVICIVSTGKTITQGSESEPLFEFKRCDFLAA